MNNQNSGSFTPGVEDWIRKAERDFHTLNALIKTHDAETADTICFSAQQCVEKYLKAVLQFHKMKIPKTHNFRTYAKAMEGE